MKTYIANTGNSFFLGNDYATQRELGGRLAVLNGLIGNPGWQPMGGYNREQMEAAGRRGNRLRSSAFTSALGRGTKALAGLARKAAIRYREYRLVRRNVAELKALDDRTMRDIGITRGDISAIAARAVSVSQVNAHRKALGRPALKLVTGDESNRTGTVSVLVEHAA